MVTFACVWVQGNVPYSVDYVRYLRAAVARNYSPRHRFVCLTDRASHLSDVDTVSVKPVPGIPGWWSKVELFNKKHELSGRVVYLDLDVLVVGGLQAIADYPAEFALVPHAGTFRGTNRLKVVPRYNSSVMAWDVSDRMHRLYDLWTPNVPRRLWGDQDYIGEMFTGEDTMPIEWFPRLSELSHLNDASAEVATRCLREHGAIVVLSKKPKNDVAAQQLSWFNDLWRAQ